MPGLSWKPEEHRKFVCVLCFVCVESNFYPRVGVGWLFCGRAGVASQCNFSVESGESVPPPALSLLTAGYHGRLPALPSLSLSLSLSVARWLAMMGAKTLLSPLTTAALTGHWDNLGNQLTLWGLLCNVIGVLERNRQLYDILYIFYNPADINVVI